MHTEHYKFLRNSVRKTILEIVLGGVAVDKNTVFDVLNNYNIEDNHIGYAYGQHDYELLMFDKNKKELLAFASYSIYNDEVSLNNIESIKKNSGFGKILMAYLAKKYGYENIERKSLTPSGAKMRKDLDDLFKFDYKKHKESKCKHINPKELDKIQNPVIKKFLKDMVVIGYVKTWEKYGEKLRSEDWVNKYDFNEISEISEWIKNSVTNKNFMEDEPPQYIIDSLSDLKQNK